MSTLKVDTIKPVTNDTDLSLKGDSSGNAVDCLNIDSSGDIDFSGNTDAKIKLPSAGGIYESDGSTAVLTESGGAVTIGATVVFPAGGTGNAISVAVITDQKSAGTAGGASSANWNTRNIGTESDPDSIVSLSSDRFTVTAGTYKVSWSCPAYKADDHRSALYDYTGTSYLVYGSCEYTGDLNSANRSFGTAIITPSGSNAYEIRHHFATAKTTNGLGVAADMGSVEIYTIVIVEKLK